MNHFRLIFLFHLVLGIRNCYSTSLRRIPDEGVEESAGGFLPNNKELNLDADMTHGEATGVLKNQHKTSERTSIREVPVAVRNSSELECYSWCKLDRSPWRSKHGVSKCNWRKCGACRQCDQRPTICASWCKYNNEYKWHAKGVAKCKWKSCGACDECKGQCVSWCKKNTTPWYSRGASKCEWPQCSACEECDDGPDEESESNAIQWACPRNVNNIETFFDTDGNDKPKWDCSCCPRDYYGWWFSSSSNGGCCKRINY